MSDLQKIQQMQNGLTSKPFTPVAWTNNPAIETKSNILQRYNEQASRDTLGPQERDAIKRFIMTMLGAPSIKVELTDEQLTNCIDLAKDVFMRYLGRERYAYTIGRSYQSEYQWPDDAISIIAIYYRPATLSALGNIAQNLFSDFYLLATDLAVDIYESPVTYWCYMASRQMLEKTYGVWGSWEMIDYRRFRVYPTPFKDQVIGMHYKVNDFDLTEDRYNLFKKLALAYAKIILGRIRSKYASIPGSNNNVLTLDGVTLLTEGSTEEEKIIKEIISMVPLRIEKF